MVHGDVKGLKMPPRVAPIQVVIVPIIGKDGNQSAIEPAVDKVEQVLAATTRVRADRRVDRSPGFKFNDWERKGVPIRLEVGPREAAADQVALVRRDTGNKQVVPLAALTDTVSRLLGGDASRPPGVRPAISVRPYRQCQFVRRTGITCGG